MQKNSSAIKKSRMFVVKNNAPIAAKQAIGIISKNN